jgi:hypothetical protein
MAIAVSMLIAHTARAQSAGYYGVVSTGQSLSVGVNSYIGISRTQTYGNKMLGGGFGGLGMGTTFVPLRESDSTETPGSALANTISANTILPAFSIALTNNGKPGYSYAELKKGTASYYNSIQQVRYARFAATAQFRPYKVIAVTVIHGETDNANYYGRGAILPQSGVYDSVLADYEANLTTWQANFETDITAITRQTDAVPMFIDQLSSFFSYYGNTATSAVPMAQLAAAEHKPDKIYLVTPKYFFQYSDLHHLTAESYSWLGEYYGKVIKRVTIDHEAWRPLSPKAIVCRDNKVVATMHVPVGRLSIDTVNVARRPNYGFEYTDDSGGQIVSVALAGTDSVVVTLSKKAGTHPRLRYAYTGRIGAIPGAQIPYAAGGNLRDNDNYPSIYGNKLYNWCVQFDKPVNVCATATPIIGPAELCTGDSVQLLCATAGGTWSCTSATASVTGTGKVLGLLAGNAAISYTISTACDLNSAVHYMVINPEPTVGPIAGSNRLCPGDSTQLSITTAGGEWTTGNTDIATVASTGMVYAVAPGNSIITYTHANTCGTAYDTLNIVVQPTGVCTPPPPPVKPDLNLTPGNAANEYILTFTAPTAEDVLITVTSMTGATVQTLTTKANQMEYIALHLPTGVYILTAQTPTNKLVRKVVVR